MSGETRYARSGDLRIAYQVIGDGPIDLVWAPGYLSHLEQNQWWPSYAHLIERLASFSRLIVFDRRGTGLSDRILSLGSFEELLDDITAVLDAATLRARRALRRRRERADVRALRRDVPGAGLGARSSAPPIRAATAAPDFPWGFDEDRAGRGPRLLRDALGRRRRSASGRSRRASPTTSGSASGTPRRAGSPAPPPRRSPGSGSRWRSTSATCCRRSACRRSCSTGPTTASCRSRPGRYLAEHIPDARLVELPGADHYPFSGDDEPFLDEVEEFLTGSRGRREPDRVLATVLFTDIVGSTERAAELGDRPLDGAPRRPPSRRPGAARPASRAGGPARRGQLPRDVRRAGAGDPLRVGDPRRGAARSGSRSGPGCTPARSSSPASASRASPCTSELGSPGLAGPGEILVSRSTVNDLVVGSGIEFDDRGAHALKGVPGEWRVYAVA